MSLPQLPVDRDWSNDIHAAFITLQNTYSNATRTFTRGQLEAHRAIFHEDQIAHIVPDLLEGLSKAVKTDGLPYDWVQEVVIAFSDLICKLENVRLTSQAM